MLNKIFNRFSAYALLPIRLALGWIFIAHGGQKLFGLWGGQGLQGFATFLQSLGLHFPLFMAFLSAGAEFFGGLAILLGAYARWGALLITIDMIVAIATVHWSHGFFIMNQGYEYNVAILGLTFAILFSGSGPFSIKPD